MLAGMGIAAVLHPPMLFAFADRPLPQAEPTLPTPRLTETRACVPPLLTLQSFLSDKSLGGLLLVFFSVRRGSRILLRWLTRGYRGDPQYSSTIIGTTMRYRYNACEKRELSANDQMQRQAVDNKRKML
jgi:hypothetical protein